MIGYTILTACVMCFVLFVGKAVVCDVRNPYKGLIDEELSLDNVSIIKTRKMYSYYEYENTKVKEGNL